MTKDEIEAAWAHLPGYAQVSIVGHPYGPDGDRKYEVVDIVRLLDEKKDIQELGDDVLQRLMAGESIIALDID